MADPKGVYYGPSETGWATVLPEGPNLAGLVTMKQRQEVLAAKREAEAAQQKAAARQKLEKEAMDALANPASTDAFYQPELDEKVKQAIVDVQRMTVEGKSPVEIRTRAALAAQEITSFAKSGTQVWADIKGMMDWNKANGRIINEDALKGYLVQNVLLDKDGKKKIPTDIYQGDGFRNAEDYIYENPAGAAAGAALLDEGAVMRNMLKSELFKNTVTEYSTTQARIQGEFIKTGMQATRTAARPFAEVLPNGEVRILDANQLEESGMLHVMLDYKPFAQLLEGDIENIKKLDSGRTYTQAEEDAMRTEAARQRLQGYGTGGTAVKKIEYESIKSRATGGGGGAGKIKGQEYWEMAVKIGDANSFREALNYLNAGISFLQPEETRNGLAQSKLIAYDMNPKAVRYEFRPAPNRYDAVQYVEYDRKGNVIPSSVKYIDREAFAESEAIKTVYAQSVKKSLRAFGTGATGGIQPEEQLKAEYEKRIRDVGTPGPPEGMGPQTYNQSEAETGGKQKQSGKAEGKPAPTKKEPAKKKLGPGGLNNLGQ